MSSYFPHLYGQEKLKRELSRSIDEDRLPNTLIFYGEEGLGKKTAAFDLAGSVTGTEEKLWDEASLWNGEEESDDLLIVLGGGLVYYLRVLPKRMELRIEQFKAFIDAMASFDDRPHVCVIDQAETMGEPVANSLLKTFEEPDANVHFILITNDLASLLPTIISRGERFPFFPLNEDDFSKLLESDPKKYKLFPGMDNKEAFDLTEGNGGALLSILHESSFNEPEHAMSFWETISRSRIPFTDLSLIASTGKKDAKKERRMFSNSLRWILLIGRDLMILNETGDERLVRCRKVIGREKRILPYWSGNKTSSALKELQLALQAVSRYINIKNIRDYLLIRLIQIQKGNTL